MKASIEISDNVIYRRFKGSVSEKDMLASWSELFEKYDDLSGFKGIITTFEGARLPGSDDDGGVQRMSELLKNKKDKLGNLRIAIVLDHPVVIKAVMVGHYVKQIQVRPFVTEEAALRWINP